MKRFVGLIGEERIVLDMATERRSMDQVGMEYQRVPFSLLGFAIAVHAGHLAGRKKDQRAFLIIVGVAAVLQIAAFYVF